MSVEHRTVTAIGARRALKKCFAKQRPMFLFFAPTWLVGEYVFDMIRFRKEKP